MLIKIVTLVFSQGRVSMKLGTPNPRPLFNRPPAPTIEAKNENKIARLARSIRRAVDIEDESQVSKRTMVSINKDLTFIIYMFIYCHCSW